MQNEKTLLEGGISTPAYVRKVCRKHVETVVEVQAEFPFFYLLLQRAVGGGDDPDITPQSLRAAHPFKLAFLKDPQEFGLGGHWQFADFIQENGAAVGEFEATLPHRDGTGECAPFDPRGRSGGLAAAKTVTSPAARRPGASRQSESVAMRMNGFMG